MILQYCTTNNQVKIPENYKYPDTKWSKKNQYVFLFLEKINLIKT